MRHLTIIFYCVGLLSPLAISTVSAGERASVKQCASWEKSLAKVNKKLRAGYTVEQGNKLREKRRKLESKLFKYCK